MVNEMQEKQYSLIKIIALWALVTLPMGLARFWIVPSLKDHVAMNPGLLFWWFMILGMVWQFVLSVIILKIELRTFTWSAVKKRLWLNHPTDQKTNKVVKWVYLLTIPIILYEFTLGGLGGLQFIQDWFLKMFPSLTPPDYMQIQNLATPEYRGAWFLIGITLLSSLFNYLLGEELFFRGVLLPKMEGVFGRWAWVANATLFSCYHVHKIEWIPIFIFSSIFCAYLNQRYRSFYPGLIIHGIEFLPLIYGVSMFVAGY